MIGAFGSPFYNMTADAGNNSINVSLSARSESGPAVLGCEANDLYGSPVVAVVAVLIGIALMGENLLMISVICRYQSLHTNTNILVASLAFSDVWIGFQCIVMGLISLPDGLRSWLALRQSEMRVLYAFLTGVNMGLIVVSMAHLAVLSLDRYLFVLWPFQYSRRVTQRRVIVTALGIWTVGCTYMSLPLMLYLDPKCHVKCFIFEAPVEYAGWPVVCVHFTCLTIVTVSTAGLARIAFKHGQKRGQLRNGDSLENYTCSGKSYMNKGNSLEMLKISTISPGEVSAATVHTNNNTKSSTVSAVNQGSEKLAIATHKQARSGKTKAGCLAVIDNYNEVRDLNMGRYEDQEAHNTSVQDTEIRNVDHSSPRTVVNFQDNADGEKNKTSNRSNKLKILKLLVLIVGCYIVCSFPAVLMMIVDDIAQVYRFSNFAQQASGLMFITSSGMNFIIMANFKTDFRDALRTFFHCSKRCN
ncbi:hypothetical protein EGW08_008375 [Elysia chlorotica]|uniref:G-protein coupled receptors family 1 profile domain-containing protein n=1 Tax=Elysia chlorotica TaxID=188477 RepID=A0A3S1C5Z6_ELYCH|nr:hypothetical protein EGW08_008375 [Elysia chlorotica]